MGSHIIDGEFQPDKYPETPRGLVPLKPTDPMAQDLLWEYAKRRESVDSEFSEDLREALRLKGYERRKKTLVISCDTESVSHPRSDNGARICLFHVVVDLEDSVWEETFGNAAEATAFMRGRYILVPGVGGNHRDRETATTYLEDR